MSHHHHTTPSRTYSTPRVSGASPRAHLVFYTFLDALAFLMGVMLGAFILGRIMAWYFFG